MTDGTRMVSAPVFAAWWDRLGELVERNPTTRRRQLLRRLGDAGRASGATHDRDGRHPALSSPRHADGAQPRL